MTGTKNVANLEKLWGGGGVSFGEVLGRFFWWDDRENDRD